jgi:hypothetical protein
VIALYAAVGFLVNIVVLHNAFVRNDPKRRELGFVGQALVTVWLALAFLPLWPLVLLWFWPRDSDTNAN